MAAGPAAAAEAVEEQSEFSVMLTNVPADKKIAVLKIVRTITGLGLKEAKTLVESFPVEIKGGVGKDEAATLKAQIEEVGAEITVK